MAELVTYMQVFDWLFTGTALFSVLVMVKDVNSTGQVRKVPPRFR